MTPIDQISPLTPANWVRRPDSRIKRRTPEDGDRPAEKEDRPDERAAGVPNGGHEHGIDELA